MFSIDQIRTAHSKVKSGADFPAYIQDLIQLGVTGYTTFLVDGHTEFSGHDGYQISSPPRYEPISISLTSNAGAFQQHLKTHQKGDTDYPTFCRQAAADGVEKWIVSMHAMTVTYYNKEGNAIVSEEIPVVNQPVI